MSDHGFALALRKTEIVMLTKKHIITVISIHVGEINIETKASEKYLGVMIDHK